MQTLSPAVLEMLATGSLPEVQWVHGDDLCDCTYQRIGMWTNPYLAETLEVRMCCIWNELYKQFPDYVRTVPGFWDENAQEWVTEMQEWNGEADMPKAMWHRQMAKKLNTTLDQVRQMGFPAPQGKKKTEPLQLWLKEDGYWFLMTHE